MTPETHRRPRDLPPILKEPVQRLGLTPLNPAQTLRAPSIRIFCEWVEEHKLQQAPREFRSSTGSKSLLCALG